MERCRKNFILKGVERSGGGNRRTSEVMKRKRRRGMI